MPRAPRLLRRFLPAGAPGPAGLAGVPADRAADAAAELAPVFAALAATESRCDEALEQGRRDAAETARRGAERVGGIAASAERRAAVERVDAVARARRTADEQAAAELTAAHAAADRLRADAGLRLPDQVARITAVVTAMVRAGTPDGPP